MNRSNVARKKESEEAISEEGQKEEIKERSEEEKEQQRPPTRPKTAEEFGNKNISAENEGRVGQERERRMSAWDRIMSQTSGNLLGTSSLPGGTTDEIPGPSNLPRKVEEDEDVKPVLAKEQRSRPPEFKLITKQSRTNYGSTVDFLTGIPSFFESNPNRESSIPTQNSNNNKRLSFCFTCENNKRNFPSSSSDTGPDNIRTLARRLKDRGNDVRRRPVPVKLFPKMGRIGRFSPMSAGTDRRNVQMLQLGRNRQKRPLSCNVQKMLNPTYSDIRKTPRCDQKAWNLGQYSRRQRRFTSPDFRKIARAYKSSTSDASVSDSESNVRVVFRSDLANLTPKPSKHTRFRPTTATQLKKHVKVGRGKVERQANVESRVDDWLRDSVAVRSKELITRTAGSVLKFLQGFSIVQRDNQKGKCLPLEDPQSCTLQLGRSNRYEEDIPMTSCGANGVGV